MNGSKDAPLLSPKPYTITPVSRFFSSIYNSDFPQSFELTICYIHFMVDTPLNSCYHCPCLSLPAIRHYL